MIIKQNRETFGLRYAIAYYMSKCYNIYALVLWAAPNLVLKTSGTEMYGDRHFTKAPVYGQMGEWLKPRDCKFRL